MTRRSLLSLATSVGSGLVLRRPSLAFQSGPRIVQADLEAKAGWFPLAGRQAYRYSYNNQVPGPLIEARPGDTIRIACRRRRTCTSTACMSRQPATRTTVS
jgi:FtsP/CotA-like multicopper oxidase with cupredoxin domain